MKKRVLFILHLPEPVHGASMVGQFIKESKLINNEFETAYINLTTANTLNTIGKINIKKPFKLFLIQFNILKSLIKSKYDLYYVSLNAKGPGFYKDLLVVILLKLFRKKIIYHFHNRGVATMQHKNLNNVLYKFTFNKTKSILLSELLYSDIAKYVNKEDVYYCPNGVPTIDFVENEEQKSLKKSSICRLLFLSNMMTEKGVYVLLDACVILQQRNIPFECHFVGAWSEISEEQLLQKINNAGLSKKIYLHGEKYGYEKHSFFNNADIFVFPTYYHNECFPLVILEAMQYSLPVISTSIGGIPDMIINNETGFIIPPMDTTALADKLEYLIRNPDLRIKMGKAARTMYNESFTLRKFEFNMKSILMQA